MKVKGHYILLNHHEEQGHGLLEETVKSSPSHEGSEGNPLFLVDPGMIIWTWIVFILLALLLGKFAWKPILKKLDEREAFIRKSLEDAQQAKQELEETTLRQEHILAEAREQAGSMVDKARESAEKIAGDIEDRAKQEANKMLLHAREEIQSERDKAVKLLRMETAGLAIKAASKLIEENLDNEKNRHLIESTIEKISRN